MPSLFVYIFENTFVTNLILKLGYVSVSDCTLQLFKTTVSLQQMRFNLMYIPIFEMKIARKE